MPSENRITDLLLLPGMMCDAGLWQAQVDALQDQYNVHVGDIGCADKVSDIAQDVLAAAPAQFAVAGLSMGGIVAMEMWRQAPERIQRIALLDTNFRADVPDRFDIRNRQIAQVRAGALREVLRDELKPNYLASGQQRNIALLDEVVEMGVRQGAGVFERQSLALRDRPDSSTTLPTIDRPVLVLCGDEDRLCSPELHREMVALLPDAELEIINNCGHLSTMEQPEAVNRALRSWLCR